MVQIYRPTPRREIPKKKEEPEETFSQKLSKGIGKGIDTALIFSRERKKEEFSKAEKKSLAKFIELEYGGKDENGNKLNVPTDLPLATYGQLLKGGMEAKSEREKYEAKQKETSKFIDRFLGSDEEKREELEETEEERLEKSQKENTKLKEENGTPKKETKELKKKLIPEAIIGKATTINPALADKLQKHNDNIMTQLRHEENLDFKRRKESPDYKREVAISTAQAKEDVDYNKQLQASVPLNEIKSQTLGKLEKLNEKGVTGKPYEKILEKWGLVNLTSEGRREFAAEVKHLITDIRSILGGQFSNFEFQTILNAYPSADFSQEANRAIINNLKEFQEMRSKEFEIANDIKRENKGKIPTDFQSMVNDRLKVYAEERLPEIKENTQKIMNEEYGIPEGFILMLDPQGEPLSVPKEMVAQYEELGAMLP